MSKPRGAAPPKKSASSLLGDDGDDAALGGFSVNKKFATRYEDRKRKQDLARAEELGLLTGGADADESSDESEDDGDLLTAGLDKKILATIQAIRSKDPKVYDAKTTFFTEADDAASSDDEGDKPKKAKKEKKKTAKDVLREQLVEAAERGATDAFADDDELDVRRKRFVDDDVEKDKKIYDDEQAQLRAAFLSSVKDSEAGDGKDKAKDKTKRKEAAAAAAAAAAAEAAAAAAAGPGSDSDDSDGGLLKLRKKEAKPAAGGDSDSEGSFLGRDDLRSYLRAKAAEEASAAAKRAKGRKGGAAGGGVKLAEHADELADPEAFLNAFARSRVWKEAEDGSDSDDGVAAGLKVPHYEDIVKDVEKDAQELERADEFEAQYNFRFEQAGGGEIVTHARGVEGSLRRKETKRKDERERKKERKEEVKAVAEAETRRLMNLKRREIQDRVGKIQEVAGGSVDYAKLAAAFADELDKEWDPAEYDRKMAALFGDDFYAEGEEGDGAAAAVAAAGGGGWAPGDDDELADAAPDAGDLASDDEDDDDDSDGEDGAGSKTGSKSGKSSGKSKVPAWVFGDGPRPAWAGPAAEDLARGVDGFEGVFKGKKGPGAHDTMALDAVDEEGEEGEDGEEEDPAVAGYGAAGRNRHKRKRKQNKQLSAVARAKASMDAEAAGGAGGAAIADPDEVLALGFEDVIAGGIKTRMAYKAVPKSDFGLTPDEILLLDDGDLNSYVGLKRLAPYREQEWVVPSKVKSRALKELRKKVASELEAAGILAKEKKDKEKERKDAKEKSKEKSSKSKDAKAEVDVEAEERDGSADEAESGAAGAAAAAAAAASGMDASKKDKSDKAAKADKADKADKTDKKAKADGKSKPAAAAAAPASSSATTAAVTAASDDSGDEDEGDAAAAAGGAHGKKKRRRRHKKGGAGGGAAAADAAAAGSSGAAPSAGGAGAAAAKPASTAAASAEVAITGQKRRHPDGSGPSGHGKPTHSGSGGHGHGHGHGQGKKGGPGHGKKAGDGDKVVTLPTGVAIKKSRLASYGL